MERKPFIEGKKLKRKMVLNDGLKQKLKTSIKKIRWAWKAPNLHKSYVNAIAYFTK